MTGEAALARIRKTLQQTAEETPAAKALIEKIRSGKASYEDTALYARWAAQNLGLSLSDVICDIDLEDRTAVCKALLLDQYEDINGFVDMVQAELDSRFGIHLAPQRAPFPAERADTIGHSLADTTKPDAVIRRRAQSATATATKAMHDDRMQAEVKFRSRAGLKCYITRTAVGGCCPWCAEVAGRYEYGEEPQDIYRRHDNCDCTVTFEDGRQRQDVWSKRTWEVPGKDAGAAEPAVLSVEQAAEREAEHLPKRLTPGAESGTISLKIRHRLMNFYEDEFYSPYTSSEIEKELQSSPIGRYVSHWIEHDGYFISMNYDENAPQNICGEVRDKSITVYPRNHDNAQEISETIIHEFAHEKFGWVDTQENEVNCRIYEYLHSHETISDEQIAEIVRFVREQYGDLPEGDLYGY